jgi:biotin carboxyl carrier protein
MKLQAEIGGEKHDIEFTRDGDQVAATVGGRAYTLEASEPESNVFLLKNDHKVTEAAVSGQAGKPFQVRIGSNEYDVKIFDCKRLRGLATGEDSGDGTSEIKTAMPGKVVRIIAPVGTVVQKGDGVIVVEAMKMQNEMKAPHDGVVRDVRVSEGENVNGGDILAVIE